MQNFINYQGSKANIIEFIKSGIQEYTFDNDTILDLFSGSGAVALALNDNYTVYANDVEPYSATLSTAILNSPRITSKKIELFENEVLINKKKLIEQEDLDDSILKERQYTQNENLNELLELYHKHETVWNSKKLTPKNLRQNNKFNLFTRYYAGSYFGIEQAIEIDSIIKTIHQLINTDKNELELYYSCLFFAIKETSFSRDGHMAQPLNFEKNKKRGFNTRKKNVFDYFFKKIYEYIDNNNFKNKKNNKIFNQPFDKLISDNDLLNNIDLIYADPPYTDMQYSRYYHLLNVARLYNYPELTKTKNGYTSGLYTEGRYQSDLSKKSKAKSQLNYLMQRCKESNVNLALSYAYPQDKKKQATDRYTVSIEELVKMANDIFGANYVKVNQIKYSHTNHKNDTHKPVIEYLILCGPNKKDIPTYDISKFKNKLANIQPTNKSPIYNTNLYWSQKSFNIIDELIESFTTTGDVIFDPFMGSGVTILESIKKYIQRKAIGCDINEMPIFIVKTILNFSFKNNLSSELKNFMTELNTLKKYYLIKCPKCNHNALIDKIIFDKPKRDSNTIKINAINIKCEYCDTKTISDEVQIYANDMFKNYNYKNIDINFKYIKNSKIAVLEDDKITNIFTNRNLKVLDEILSLSLNYSNETSSVIKYILMSIMHQCKITDKRSNSQWPLWIPKKDCVERNIIFLLEKKLTTYIKTLKNIYTDYHPNSLVNSFDELKPCNAFIIHKACQFIEESEIPSDSVDLIITDPPYLEQVLYSEYMQLYAPILHLDFNLKDEIVVSSGENRNKTKDDYYDSLYKAFDLCQHKLKKNKLMCLYFHDSNLDVWYRLIKILYELGFDFRGQVHIKKNSTLKNIISPQKSLNGDSILFFNNSKQHRNFIDGQESIDEIETNIIAEAKYMILSHGPLSTPELYDNGLMEILIDNGWLRKISKKYRSLIDIFEKHLSWDKNIGKWCLKE